MTLSTAPVPTPILVLVAAAIWFAITSLAAWVRFRQDKRLAMSGLQRIPEANLLRLAMIGGWPGAKLAQRRFRHKTRKEPFRSQLNLCALPALAILVTSLMLAWSTMGREVSLTWLSGTGSGFGLSPGPETQTARPMPRRFGPGSETW